MAARAFCLWPQRTLDIVTSQITVMFERWHEDWGLECNSRLEPALVARRNDVSGQSMKWQLGLLTGGGKGWFGWNSSLQPALSDALYATARTCLPAPDSIVAEAGVACMAGFTEQLWTELQAHPGDVVPPPDEVWQPGSGALMLLMTLGNGTGCLVLNQDAVLQMCPRSMAPELPVPTPIQATALLTNRIVSLQVSPGSVSLSMAEICSLAVGNVIALDIPIDQPLRLLTPVGAPVCGARLLRNGERKVLSVCPINEY